MVQGLDYLHSYGVIHRGLTSVSHMIDPVVRGVILMIFLKQNIIVNTAGRACLSDIGFTTSAHGEESITDSTESSTHGSRWAAPEVLKDDNFSKQSDVFSFGFVAAEVCSR